MISFACTNIFYVRFILKFQVFETHITLLIQSVALIKRKVFIQPLPKYSNHDSNQIIFSQLSQLLNFLHISAKILFKHPVNENFEINISIACVEEKLIKNTNISKSFYFFFNVPLGEKRFGYPKVLQDFIILKQLQKR